MRNRNMDQAAPGFHEISRAKGPNAGSARGRLWEGLVAVDWHSSLLLLVGGGLLLRSFAQLRAIDPGFRTDHLLTLGMMLPDAGYDGPAKIEAFFEELLRRTRSLPGVISAGIVSNMPLMGHWGDEPFTIEGGRPVKPEQMPDAVDLWADSGYFHVMGIALLRGRVFTTADGRAKDLGVVVISRSTARTFWPGEDPLGQHIRLGASGPRYQVIGIVGDVLSALGNPPEPSMYLPSLTPAPAARFS